MCRAAELAETTDSRGRLTAPHTYRGHYACSPLSPSSTSVSAMAASRSPMGNTETVLLGGARTSTCKARATHPARRPVRRRSRASPSALNASVSQK